MGEAGRQVERAEAEVTDDALLCPRCGYDMRIDTGERCSECGEIVDRASLGVSGFPWAHRKSMGWIRAYFKTVWLVSVGSRQLKNEAARPQDLRGARVFARINGAILAACFLWAFITAAVGSEGLSFVAVYPPDGFWWTRNSRWYFDLLVPWSNGATLWPVVPVMLVLLAFYLVGVQRRLFEIAEASAVRRERGEAIACYASAPVVWWPVVAGVIAVMYLPVEVAKPAVQVSILGVFLFIIAHLCFRLRRRRLLLWIGMLALLCVACMMLAWTAIEAAELYGRHPARITTVWVLAVAGLGLPLVRCAQWSGRVKHRGAEHMMLDIPHLLGLWVMGVVALLGILPWCIGFIWLVIDSFL